MKDISSRSFAVMTLSVLILSVIVCKCVASHAETSDKSEEDSVSIVFGGDVDFSRIIQYNHKKRNCSYSEMFEELSPSFGSADFAMVNLENVIKEHRKKNEFSGAPLYSDEGVLLAIKQANINGVFLANNHISDYREVGTNVTIQLLDKYRIDHVGIISGTDPFADQKPLILEKKGIRIGILAYCDLLLCQRNWQKLNVGPAMVKVSAVISQVKALRKKKQCDIVILFMHWATEYSNVIPLNVLMLIRDLLKEVHIDVIAGSHPHVTIKHWYMGNTLIAPSLGNLIFTTVWLASFNFNTLCRKKGKQGKINDVLFERIWYKQMHEIRMENPSSYGRLLRLKFNKKGIIKDESQYLNTKVKVTKQHCLYAGKGDGAEWTTICDPQGNDKECVGTDDCNYLTCDGQEIFPQKIASEFPEWRLP